MPKASQRCDGGETLWQLIFDQDKVDVDVSFVPLGMLGHHGKTQLCGVFGSPRLFRHDHQVDIAASRALFS